MYIRFNLRSSLNSLMGGRHEVEVEVLPIGRSGGRDCLAEACAADAYVMRFVESGIITMMVVIHMTRYFYAIGLKGWRDQFGTDGSAHFQLGRSALVCGLPIFS